MIKIFKKQEIDALDVHQEIQQIINEGRYAVKGFHRMSGLMIVMTAIGALLAMEPKVFDLLVPIPWLAQAINITVTLVILYGGVVSMRAAGRNIRNARARGEKAAFTDVAMQQTIMLIEGGSFSYFLLMAAHILPATEWINSVLTVCRGIMLPLSTNYLEGQRAHNIGAEDILHVSTAAVGEISATKLVDEANNNDVSTWEAAELLLTIAPMKKHTETRLREFVDVLKRQGQDRVLTPEFEDDSEQEQEEETPTNEANSDSPNEPVSTSENEDEKKATEKPKTRRTRTRKTTKKSTKPAPEMTQDERVSTLVEMMKSGTIPSVRDVMKMFTISNAVAQADLREAKAKVGVRTPAGPVGESDNQPPKPVDIPDDTEQESTPQISLI